MILANKCEHCGQFTYLGFMNEYNQAFCSEKCYELYCAIHGYDINKTNLRKINNF